MKKKLISVLLTLAVAGTMLAGCGSSKADDTKSEADSSTEKKDITIGVRADMVNQYAAVEDKLKELGYNVQSKVFDDSVQPDQTEKILEMIAAKALAAFQTAEKTA